MTVYEANNIVAKFIGLEPYREINKTRVSEGVYDVHLVKVFLSLDALVPVWYEFNKYNLEVGLNLYKDENSYCTIWKGEQGDCCGFYERHWCDELGEAQGKTLQEVALIATAKAILKLRNNNEETN